MRLIPCEPQFLWCVGWWYKLLIFGFLAALFYHSLAGIRHLFMDLGFGETLVSARRSAWFVLLLAVIIIVALGVWIC